MKKAAEGARRIDMAILQFYELGQAPSHLRVRDITLPLITPILGYITGLSGHSSRSVTYAGQYAKAQEKEMVMVNLAVSYQQSMPMYKGVLEVVKEYDALNILRATNDLIAHIAAYWKQWIIEDEGAAAEGEYSWKRPDDFIARRPDFIPRLLQQKEFEHIHLFTHPVYTLFHDKPVTVTSFRADYPFIESARARLHPDIEVTLD